MKRLARDLGVDGRTHFLGWQRDPSPFLKAVDILVCPSDDEPLGNVVLEGWNAGLPVAATASPGPSWLIEHGKTGLLSPCGDVEGLVGSIEATIHDRNLPGSLITSTGKYAARIGQDEICDEYLALLNDA